MRTANLSWFFNCEYFDGLFTTLKPSTIERRNQELRCADPIIPGSIIPEPFNACESSFDLQVEYPGLLAGIGYQHAIGEKGEIGLGFSLDYVTGLPYLPGSSVKGALRAAFVHEDYIAELLQRLKVTADVGKLERAIFGNRIEHEDSKTTPGADVFLDAFPVRGAGNGLLELDAITPHSDFEDPVPLTMLKVRPGVVMRFRFLLKETLGLSPSNKCDLFRQIFLDLGAGAKTNVGYGRFTDEIKASEQVATKSQIPEQAERATEDADLQTHTPTPKGRCGTCGAPTGINKKTGIPYPYCSKHRI